MNSVRRTISIASMLSGVVLFVAGLGVRAGVIPISVGGTSSPAPSDGVAVMAPSPVSSVTALVGDPSAAAPSVPPSTPASPPASPSPSADGAELWFADDFDTVAAWPDGKLDWATTSIADGHFRIDARETDLPFFIMAAAGEGAPGSSVSVTANLSIAARAEPASAAGIALEDADGTRLLALVSADGRVSLFRDSIESFDGVASGSVVAPTGVFELTLALGGETATVSLDGNQIASARATLETIRVGLGVWAVGGPATIDVDSYRVSTGR